MSLPLGDIACQGTSVCSVVELAKSQAEMGVDISTHGVLTALARNHIPTHTPEFNVLLAHADYEIVFKRTKVKRVRLKQQRWRSVPQLYVQDALYR